MNRLEVGPADRKSRPGSWLRFHGGTRAAVAGAAACGGAGLPRAPNPARVGPAAGCAALRARARPLFHGPRALLRRAGRLLGLPGRGSLGPTPGPGAASGCGDPRPRPFGRALCALALRPGRGLRRHRYPGPCRRASLLPPLRAVSDTAGWRGAGDPHHPRPLWLGCSPHGPLEPSILHGPPGRSPCHVASKGQRPTLLLPLGQSWVFS